MNKLYGSIIGLLSGIIGATIWIYRDTLVHPDCESLWKCSSSALFKFGVINFVIIVAVTCAIIGLIVGFILDKKY